MMKKFFYLTAILTIVLVSCNSEKEYIAKLSNTASMIEKEADLSEAITLHYCDTWRKVIYDHEYNGEYCTDFNEALAKHQEFIITTDTYKRLKQKRDSIEAIMPQLNDYPSSCKDAYNDAKGGLFKNASVIGVGEAGQEAVLPLENQKAMKSIADSIMSGYDGNMGLTKDEIMEAVERGDRKSVV